MTGGGSGWSWVSRKSTLGPPPAVVAVARIVLVPAFNVTMAVTVCQVLHAPVGGKASSSANRVPLAVMSIGRFAVLPLAYRNVRAAVPACAAFTVQCTLLPTTAS